MTRPGRSESRSKSPDASDTATPKPTGDDGDVFDNVVGFLRTASDSRSRAAVDAETAGEQPASPNRRIKICFLINHLAPDGAPTVVKNLVAHLPTDEVEATVCYFGGDGSLQSPMEDTGVRVVDFGATTEYPQFDPRSFPSMAAFFFQESFDILHCHLPYSQSLGRVVGRLSGIDHVVSTQHNVPSNYHPIERLAERGTRRLDSTTVAVSGGVESAFTGAPPSRLSDDGQWCTIQNGIDVDEFSTAVSDADPDRVRARWGVEDANPLLLSVARYEPQKGHRSLVAAMDAVVESTPSAHLLLVGWGSLESELRLAVRDRGLTDAVTVTGRVPEIHRYYAAADLFVSASRLEGLPITLLEAMSARLPVVATDIPGVREVIVESKTGHLVPPDTPDELADTITRLSNRSLCEQLGFEAFEHVSEQFSVERMATDYLALYRDLAWD